MNKRVYKERNQWGSNFRMFGWDEDLDVYDTNLKITRFAGITGNVTIDANGDRKADYSLLDMNPETGKFEVKSQIKEISLSLAWWIQAMQLFAKIYIVNSDSCGGRGW